MTKRSRYYSPVQRQRREWQRLQQQLEWGFPDTRQLYPEEDDDSCWHMNEDPYEQLGPLSEWMRRRDSEYVSRCRKHGDLRAKRHLLRNRRQRTRHWFEDYDRAYRCPECQTFYGWNEDGTDSINPGAENGF